MRAVVQPDASRKRGRGSALRPGCNSPGAEEELKRGDQAKNLQRGWRRPPHFDASDSGRYCPRSLNQASSRAPRAARSTALPSTHAGSLVMTRSYLSPFGQWVQRTRMRIEHEEMRAKLGEAWANAPKQAKTEQPRMGCSPRRKVEES